MPLASLDQFSVLQALSIMASHQEGASNDTSSSVWAIQSVAANWQPTIERERGTERKCEKQVGEKIRDLVNLTQ